MSGLDYLVGTALALALLVSSCGDGAESASSSTSDSGERAAIVRLVGAVEETDVHVAMLLGGGKARLYFCGGPESHATATRWLDVGFDGGEHVEFEEQTWRVHAHLLWDSARGEVELGDGVTRMFSAELVAADTIAGLYEGKADCGRLGLIVSQTAKGVLPTAQGACADDMLEESAQPISPVTPLHLEAGKIRVRVPGAGDSTLLLQAATLQPL